MPSGAKKRKAAKRKEEQQQLGSHSPGSPTTPTAGQPHPPQQGNGQRDNYDDMTTQEGKETESGSGLGPPAAEGNGHHPLEVEAEEQPKSRVGEEGRKESEISAAMNTDSVMEKAENEASDKTSDPLLSQRAEVEGFEKIETEVPVCVVDALKNDVSPLPHSGFITPTISTEVPILKLEEMGAKYLQSESGKEVALCEGKESNVLEAASHELSAPLSEEVVQPVAVSVETLEVVESTVAGSSSKDKVNAVPPVGAASQQQDLGSEGHQIESREAAGTSEVPPPTHLKQRTSWMNCCGLFDVITGAN